MVPLSLMLCVSPPVAANAGLMFPINCCRCLLRRSWRSIRWCHCAPSCHKQCSSSSSGEFAGGPMTMLSWSPIRPAGLGGCGNATANPPSEPSRGLHSSILLLLSAPEQVSLRSSHPRLLSAHLSAVRQTKHLRRQEERLLCDRRSVRSAPLSSRSAPACALLPVAHTLHGSFSFDRDDLNSNLDRLRARC